MLESLKFAPNNVPHGGRATLISSSEFHLAQMPLFPRKLAVHGCLQGGPGSQRVSREGVNPARPLAVPVNFPNGQHALNTCCGGTFASCEPVSPSVDEKTWLPGTERWSHMAARCVWVTVPEETFE